MATLVLLLGVLCMLFGIGGMGWEGVKKVRSQKGLARCITLFVIGAVIVIGGMKIHGQPTVVTTAEQRASVQSYTYAERMYLWMLNEFIQDTPTPVPTAVPTVVPTAAVLAPPLVVAPPNAPPLGTGYYYRGTAVNPDALRVIYQAARTGGV